MENNPAILKSSMFGGFKKKDVLSYIFELNEATQDEKQKLAEQLDELAHSSESLSAKVTEMERRISELQENLDDTTARLSEATRTNEEYAETIERLKAEVSGHESAASQHKAEIARHTELNAELTEKNRGYEEKRNQVELAASQIADLLNQAKRDAGSVVDRAKIEAEGIVKKAKASIEVHVGEANRSMDDAYKKFGDFKTELETLHETIAGAASDMTTKIQSLKDAVSNIEKLVPEKLSVDALPALQYTHESEPVADAPKPADTVAVTAAPISSADAEGASTMTTDVLRRYGVRKDDSGFFRLASDA